MSKNIALLHIYGPEQQHDEVHIVGNIKGLNLLRDAIASAIKDGSAKQDKVFVNDGEGFSLHVIRNNDDWLGDFWTRLAAPYTSEYAIDNRDNAVWPWTLLAGENPACPPEVRDETL